MSLPADEEFRENLLPQIEDRRGIPVVGREVITYGENDQLYYPKFTPSSLCGLLGFGA
jgi:hypothetical protein